MASLLFKTKSPEHLMAEAAAPERLMKRSLSALDLTCLGIGAIIGSGIFVLTGTAAAGEQVQTASVLKTPVINLIQAWLAHAPIFF
jgi:APA family basic amino acid/polyamine antiporter